MAWAYAKVRAGIGRRSSVRLSGLNQKELFDTSDCSNEHRVKVHALPCGDFAAKFALLALASCNAARRLVKYLPLRQMT